MTRTILIEVWFGIVALSAVLLVALGSGITWGTGLLLLALSVVPPVVLFVLWPTAQPPTASQVLHTSGTQWQRPR